MKFIDFSSEDFPQQKLSTAFEEVFGPICNMNIQIEGSDVRTESRIAVHDSFAFADTEIRNHWSDRSYSHIADGDDSMLLVLPRSGIMGVNADGRGEQVCRPGQMYVVPTDQRFGTRDEGYVHVLNVTVPRDWVEKRMLQRDLLVGKVQTPTDSSALQLLMRYTDHVLASKDAMTPKLAELVELQFLDLLALTLDVDVDSCHLASNRGMKDVQFKFICDFIRDNIADPKLDIHVVSKKHNISPQSIRKLFQRAGTNFIDYVNGLRLDWVFQALKNPVAPKKSISSLAYAVGFNNLAWFNRAFKQRFDVVPSEVLSGGKKFR